MVWEPPLVMVGTVEEYVPLSDVLYVMVVPLVQSDEISSINVLFVQLCALPVYDNFTGLDVRVWGHI